MIRLEVIVMSMLDSLNSIIDSNYESLETMKRKYGVVKKLIPNTDSAKVKVKIRNITNDDYITPEENEEEQEDPDEKNWLTLLNKTGERLAVCDCIWVYYWRTITDGYVAIKIGKHDYTRFGVKLEKAMTITDHLDTVEKISENSDEFKIQNNASYGYGSTPNVIYICGIPAVYYSGLSGLTSYGIYPRELADLSHESQTRRDRQQRIIDFKNFVLGLNSSLFIKAANNVFATNGACYDFRMTNPRIYIAGTGFKNAQIPSSNGYVYKSAQMWKHELNTDRWTTIDGYRDYYDSSARDMEYQDTNSDIFYERYDGAYGHESYQKLHETFLYDYTYANTLANSMNCGFLFLYDKAYFFDGATPYGHIEGRWVIRGFGKRYGATENDVLLEGDYVFSRTTFTGSYCFSSLDEREYARQILSRAESFPY